MMISDSGLLFGPPCRCKFRDRRQFGLWWLLQCL